MESTYNLVIHDGTGEIGPIVLSFKTRITNPYDAEQAARRAVRAYLATGEGQADIAANNGEFNWGDVVNSVPAGFFHQQGLTIINDPSFETEVDHDEHLSGTDVPLGCEKVIG